MLLRAETTSDTSSYDQAACEGDAKCVDSGSPRHVLRDRNKFDKDTCKPCDTSFVGVGGTPVVPLFMCNAWVDMPLENSDETTSIYCIDATLLAWELRKYSQVIVVLLRWSPHDAHCTRACPGGVVYVVGALG